MSKASTRIQASPTRAIGRGGPRPAPLATTPMGTTLLAAALLAAFGGPLSAQERGASVSVVDSEALAWRAPLRIGDTLADVPGVYLRGAAFGASPPASGQAVLSLRGIPRTVRTLVMIDGHPINNALSGGINVASLITDQIDRIEVVRGPRSSLYGSEAIGGVIQIFTRRGGGETRVYGSVGAGSNDTYQSQVGLAGGGERSWLSLGVSHHRLQRLQRSGRLRRGGTG